MTPQEKVREFHAAGYRVEVAHLRRSKVFHPGTMSEFKGGPDERGGYTSCCVTSPDGDFLHYSGNATCSKAEPFVRRRGFAIAVGRAYKKWELDGKPREDRRRVPPLDEVAV